MFKPGSFPDASNIFCVSGFQLLEVDDQIKLALDALYPVLLVYYSQYYDIETGEHIFFVYTREERDLILRVMPPFASLKSHFCTTGFALKQLNMSAVEIAFLAAMTVLTSAGK
jgi:hypothetical protein